MYPITFAFKSVLIGSAQIFKIHNYENVLSIIILCLVSCLGGQVTAGPARPRHGTGPGCRENNTEKNKNKTSQSKVFLLNTHLLLFVVLKINLNKNIFARYFFLAMV